MSRWVCGLAVDGWLVVGRCSVALTKPKIKCLQLKNFIKLELYYPLG